MVAILTGAFFFAAFATILTPGPNMIYVATTGGERGPRSGVLAAAAIVLGGVCYTLATALGISAAMAAFPGLFIAIRVAGIIYLVYLGIKQVNRARDTTPLAPAAEATRGVFRTGLIISLTNPQLATFFLAFLPQFIPANSGPVWLQFLRLGLTFNACSFTVMCTIGIVTGLLRTVAVADVRFRQGMRAVTGVAFIAVAVKSTLSLIK